MVLEYFRVDIYTLNGEAFFKIRMVVIIGTIQAPRWSPNLVIMSINIKKLFNNTILKTIN